jgi:hypothetical protein
MALQVVSSVTPVAAAGIRLLVSAGSVRGTQRSTFENIDFFNLQKCVAIDKGALEDWVGIDQLDPNKYNSWLNLRMHPSAAMDYGIWWEGGSSTHNMVMNCKLRGSVACIKAGDGGADTSVGDFTIFGNTMTAVGGAGRCIDIAGPSDSTRYHQKVTIIANDFDGSMIEAMRITDMGNSRIFGNSGLDKGYTITPHTNMVLENNGISFLETRKTTAATTVNNSTTLVDVTALAIELDANEDAEFDLNLRVDSNATADIKLGFSYPAGCTIRWAFVGGRWDPPGVWTQTDELSETSTPGVSGIGLVQWIHLKGFIANQATAGTVTPQFAQVSADVSDTTVEGLSTFVVRRIRNNIG